MGFFSSIGKAFQGLGRGLESGFHKLAYLGASTYGGQDSTTIGKREQREAFEGANAAAAAAARSQEQAGMLAYGQELKRLRAKRGFASTMLSAGGSLGGGTAGGKTSLG